MQHGDQRDNAAGKTCGLLIAQSDEEQQQHAGQHRRNDKPCRQHPNLSRENGADARFLDARIREGIRQRLQQALLGVFGEALRDGEHQLGHAGGEVVQFLHGHILAKILLRGIFKISGGKRRSGRIGIDADRAAAQLQTHRRAHHNGHQHNQNHGRCGND